MSAPVTAANKKVCCKCGKVVNGQKRMRDSEGRYWCLACGQADQKVKKANTGTPCAACGEHFPQRKLKEYGRLQYCKTCFRKVTGSSGGFLAGLLGGGGGGAESEAKRKKLMLVALLLLGLVSYLINFVLFSSE